MVGWLVGGLVGWLIGWVGFGTVRFVPDMQATPLARLNGMPTAFLPPDCVPSLPHCDANISPVYPTHPHTHPHGDHRCPYHMDLLRLLLPLSPFRDLPPSAFLFSLYLNRTIFRTSLL